MGTGPSRSESPVLLVFVHELLRRLISAAVLLGEIAKIEASSAAPAIRRKHLTWYQSWFRFGDGTEETGVGLVAPSGTMKNIPAEQAVRG